MRYEYNGTKLTNHKVVLRRVNRISVNFSAAKRRCSLSTSLYIIYTECPRTLLQDLIPELILSQKLHIHMGPIRNGSGVMNF